MQKTVFNYNGIDLNAIIINGTLWLVATEVCPILGIYDCNSTLAIISSEDKQIFMGTKGKKTILINSFAVEKMGGDEHFLEWMDDKVATYSIDKIKPKKKSITKLTDTNISKGLSMGKPPKKK